MSVLVVLCVSTAAGVGLALMACKAVLGVMPRRDP
jgi:hypothetical protein